MHVCKLPAMIFHADSLAMTQELWIWLTKHMGLDVCSRIMKVSMGIFLYCQVSTNLMQLGTSMI